MEITDLELERVLYDKTTHFKAFVNGIIFRNMHEHSAFEISVILSGNAKIRCKNGEFYVHPGSILLFNPYDPHELSSNATEPFRVLALQVSNHFCQDYFPSLPNILLTSGDITNILNENERKLIVEMALSAARAFLKEEYAFQFESVGTVALLLTNLIRAVPHRILSDGEFFGRKNKTNRIRRIINYINQHYMENISLKALAESEGITSTHLSHFFREAFHMSFQEYLAAMRFERAVVLIGDPALNISDICIRTGFSESRYLNAMFQKEFGCSATEYRQRLANLVVSRREPSNRHYSEKCYSAGESLEILDNFEKMLNERECYKNLIVNNERK